VNFWHRYRLPQPRVIVGCVDPEGRAVSPACTKSISWRGSEFVFVYP